MNPFAYTLRTVVIAGLASLAVLSAPARSAPAPDPTQAARATPEIRLKAASPPLTSTAEGGETIGSSRFAFNVSQPTLTPFLPPEGKGNGTAIIIAPGGGFMMLSVSGEGTDVARWLADNGVAAFVLKYRLMPAPSSIAGVTAALMPRLTAKERFEDASWWADGLRVATEDAAEAMRTVRANAAAWGIDPKKVGFMGFSAGAFTTLGLVSRDDPATMPDFVVPIYGSVSTPRAPLPASLPPMWAALAADDPLFGATDYGLLRAWREKGGATEFHLYASGGHGFGFKGAGTAANWTSHFLAWLRERGLTPPEASADKPARHQSGRRD